MSEFHDYWNAKITWHALKSVKSLPNVEVRRRTEEEVTTHVVILLSTLGFDV